VSGPAAALPLSPGSPAPHGDAALDTLLWAFLDPAGTHPPRPEHAEAALAPRWVEPGVVRRLAELAVQHVLLRELAQEEQAAPAAAAALEDAELVRQAEQDVPGAFDTLVERYFNLVAAAAYAILSDAEAARDVAQDAFLEAARTLKLLRERDKFGNWVYGIARRKAIYVLRRKKLHHAALQYRQDEERAQPPPEDPGGPMARRERAAQIREALNHLPEIYREILVLKYMDGRSYEEIATLLSLSISAVDKRLTRAKALLRDSLKRWLDE
jgi:RNA polymerase sigma-70 factor (ECF subfamily)